MIAALLASADHDRLRARLAEIDAADTEVAAAQERLRRCARAIHEVKASTASAREDLRRATSDVPADRLGQLLEGGGTKALEETAFDRAQRRLSCQALVDQLVSDEGVLDHEHQRLHALAQQAKSARDSARGAFVRAVGADLLTAYHAAVNDFLRDIYVPIRAVVDDLTQLGHSSPAIGHVLNIRLSSPHGATLNGMVPKLLVEGRQVYESEVWAPDARAASQTSAGKILERIQSELRAALERPNAALDGVSAAPRDPDDGGRSA